MRLRPRPLAPARPVIQIEQFGDVTRIRLASWGSIAAGMHVSAYLTRGVLVDTGFAHASRVIARLVAERRPAGAMLTHWHEDHAGNADLLAACGIPLAMSVATEAQLRSSARLRTYRRVVWGTPPALRTAFERLQHPALELLPAPGHSADHHVVWDAERETLFSGDLWLGVRTRVMHEDEEPYRILSSLRAVIALRPRRMFDAHRGAVSNPVAALGARAAWLEETIAAIQGRLDAGWETRAIVREVLQGEEPVAYLSGGEYARRNFVEAVRRGR